MEHEAAMAGRGAERSSINKDEGRFGSFPNLFSLTLKALSPAPSAAALAVAPAVAPAAAAGGEPAVAAASTATKGKKKASGDDDDADDDGHAHPAGRTPVSNASSSDHTASTVGTAMQTPATAPPPPPPQPDPQCRHSTGPNSKKRCRLFIVLDASGVNFTDLSGMRALADVNKDLREHGVRLLIARAKHRLRDKLRCDPRLFSDLGGEKMYLSLEEMVLLLERHDMRLHGTPFPSGADLQALANTTSTANLGTSLVLPPGAMGSAAAASETSSRAATPPNGPTTPTLASGAGGGGSGGSGLRISADVTAVGGPAPVPSVSGSGRAMMLGTQAASLSSLSGGVAPMVNVVVQGPVIGESGEKDELGREKEEEDDYAVGVDAGGVLWGGGSSRVNSSAASDAGDGDAIGGSQGRIV